MDTYLVQTVSGMVQEELIHYKDAIDVAQWMVLEYATDVEVFKNDELIEQFTLS